MEIQPKQTVWQQFIRFSISGGAFFWSGYILFALLYGPLGLGIGLSKVVSYVFGLTVNFLLNRWWVFRTHQPKKNLPKVTGRYLFLSAVNLGIDYVVVISLANAGLTPYIGQFISAGLSTLWNFVLYKYWVFHNVEDRR